MPSHADLVAVAKAMRIRLGDLAFVTVPSMEITETLRRKPGEATTRIKGDCEWELELAMLEQGVRCFPPLSETSTDDEVRLFHPGSPVADLVDAIARPSPSTDQHLAEVANMLMREIREKHELEERPLPDDPSGRKTTLMLNIEARLDTPIEELLAMPGTTEVAKLMSVTRFCVWKWREKLGITPREGRGKTVTDEYGAYADNPGSLGGPLLGVAQLMTATLCRNRSEQPERA